MSKRPEPGHLARLQLAPGAGLELVQGQPGIAAAVEPTDRVADRCEHPLDLVLAALLDRELDFVRAEARCLGRRGRAVVELDALLEASERFVCRLDTDLANVN